MSLAEMECVLRSNNFDSENKIHGTQVTHFKTFAQCFLKFLLFVMVVRCQNKIVDIDYYDDDD